MVDFVPGRAVIDAAQRKRGKYMNMCAAIGYGFLPFSFSSLGELEADAVTLLKRIRKFSITQDIGARTAIHIFNRISFSIAKGKLAPEAPFVFGHLDLEHSLGSSLSQPFVVAAVVASVVAAVAVVASAVVAWVVVAAVASAVAVAATVESVAAVVACVAFAVVVVAFDRGVAEVEAAVAVVDLISVV
ncbi:hypothetical protein Tco_0989609 [Tanacetum coccineum]|uniref:Uncharacterized protein n=1 Tax=Tanacetum coccineum TaxID=301880 RepID=A0ABQ5EV91_9ASTR